MWEFDVVEPGIVRVASWLFGAAGVRIVDLAKGSWMRCKVMEKDVSIGT